LCVQFKKKYGPASVLTCIGRNTFPLSISKQFLIYVITTGRPRHAHMLTKTCDECNEHGSTTKNTCTFMRMILFVAPTDDFAVALVWYRVIFGNHTNERYFYSYMEAEADDG
jgi:hypothetical protein